MADTVGLMVYEGAGVTLVHILPILVWIWANDKGTNMKTQQGKVMTALSSFFSLLIM